MEINSNRLIIVTIEIRNMIGSKTKNLKRNRTETQHTI